MKEKWTSALPSASSCSTWLQRAYRVPSPGLGFSQVSTGVGGHRSPNNFKDWPGDAQTLWSEFPEDIMHPAAFRGTSAWSCTLSHTFSWSRLHWCTLFPELSLPMARRIWNGQSDFLIFVKHWGLWGGFRPISIYASVGYETVHVKAHII